MYFDLFLMQAVSFQHVINTTTKTNKLYIQITIEHKEHKLKHKLNNIKQQLNTNHQKQAKSMVCILPIKVNSIINTKYLIDLLQQTLLYFFKR